MFISKTFRGISTHTVVEPLWSLQSFSKESLSLSKNKHMFSQAAMLEEAAPDHAI